MKAVVWNCRGVESPLTVPQLREVVRLYSPSLVFLSDTKKKKSYLNSVMQWIRFDKVFVVDLVGRAGGLAVIWKQELRVKRVLLTSFTIELLIEDTEFGFDWWCICAYASSDAGIRKEQWNVIYRRSAMWGEHWAIMGDLNDITSNGEKWGGNLRAEVRFQDFNSFINNNELVDIGFEGVSWTWCNNWGNEGEVKERLDRILGTKEWIRKMDKAKCLHVKTEALDHCMLVLDTNPGGKK
ncbi:uncharacterized protein [Coffea arabica]|uniref:Endonuclease/exonuclease/phosphatase domain-containing protein n=1 Tax=Coffea arabica TaxID=13443 RepID=A0ABM4VCC1_COFAR